MTIRQLIFCSLLLTSFYSIAEEKSRFSFAVIGDLPYGVAKGKDDKPLSNLIAQLNQDEDINMVIHVGDIKTGGSRCSDAMLEDRKARFDNIALPFVYTPGDNEWTDCHRFTAGRYDPLERLEKLRSLFFMSEKAKQTRSTLNITQQSNVHKNHNHLIENYSWNINGVQFATIHIVGSLNGKAKFSKTAKMTRNKHHDDEVASREKAAVDWLKYNFDVAKKTDARAMFIAIHANPGLDLRWEKETRPAYRFFNKALLKQIKKFNKPVVLTHGDSHYVRIDKPSLTGEEPLRNFTRLESFGENNNAWIKVHVDPNSDTVFNYTLFDRIKAKEDNVITPQEND